MLQSDMSTELSVVADPKGPEKMEFLNTVTDFFSRVTENRKYNRKGNPFKKSTAQPIPFVGSLKITFKTEDGISEGLGYGITQQFLSGTKISFFFKKNQSTDTWFVNFSRVNISSKDLHLTWTCTNLKDTGLL